MSSTQAQSPMTATPLLEAFIQTLQLLGFPKSTQSILNGLPSDSAFTEDLLLRACERLGLSASISEVNFSELRNSDLPLILLPLQNQSSTNDIAVLHKLNNTDEFDLVLFDENAKRTETSYALAELSERFGTTCIIVRQPQSEPNNTKQKAGFSSWLWREVFKLKSVYRDIALATIMLNLFVLASPLFVMNVYDRVVPNQATETLWVLVSGVCLVFLFDLVIKLLRHYFIELAGRRIDVVLSSKLFTHVMSLKFECRPSSVGSMANQLRDFDNIKQFFAAASMASLIDLPFALLFLLIIYSLGGAVGIAPLVAAILIITFGLIIHFPLKGVIKKTQSAAARKHAILIESLTANETIKSFNAEGRQQTLWERCLHYLSDHGFQARRLADSIGIVSGFLMQLAVVAVVAIGVYQIETNAMSLGALIACVLLTSRALAPMAQLANLAAQFYQAREALSTLNDISGLPTEQGEQTRYLQHDKLSGKLELKDVSFGYDNKQTILKNLNITIRAGEHVALIGKIGSGKSTLLRLLLGLGKVSQGQIKVDDIDIEQINPADLRANMAYVPQDIHLLSGTLRENIALKSPLSDDQTLLNTARLSGLESFIKSHAMGLDMPIGEQGQGLSGGQRQSVAVARALLGDPQVLLFDELTSAMDNQTEGQVLAAIEKISQDKTLVLSTHRASLLKLVDRIIVLDDGRIVADGPKEKVLEALKKGLIQTGAQA